MIEKKPRVLIVHNYYQIPGGEDTVVANEKKLLEENGHDVFLYTRSNDEINHTSFLKKTALPFVAIFNPRTYFEIRRIIKDRKIDIVHVHNTQTLVSPSVYYASVRSGKPIVQTIHNFRLICPAGTLYRDGHICEDCLKKDLRNAIKYNCYRNSKIQTTIIVLGLFIHKRLGIYKKIHFICLTDFNKEKLLSHKQILSKRIFVKPNFTLAEKPFVDYENRKNQYIYVGRLDETKGIKTLFESWKLIGANAPRLLVCGTGPLLSWCEKFIEDNLIESITMLYQMDNSEILDLISVSKALILPTNWYEGFPMVIVESFSVGTPVITTDIGNAGNLVCEGVSGWKFSPNNAQSLVSAVSKTSDLCCEVKSINQNKYTKLKNYENLINIYNVVCFGKSEKHDRIKNT